MGARRAWVLGLVFAAFALTACPSPINVARDDARVRIDSGALDGGSGADVGEVDDSGRVGTDGAADASDIDVGFADAEAPEAGPVDAAEPDAAAPDAAEPDAGALDAAAPDVGHLDSRLSPADGAGASCQYVGGFGECGGAEVCRFYSPLEGRCESCSACGNLHAPCTNSSDCDIVFVCFEGVCTNFCVLGLQTCGKEPCVDVGYPDTGVCAP